MLQSCFSLNKLIKPYFLMLIEGLNKKVRIDNGLRLTETLYFLNYGSQHIVSSINIAQYKFH